GIGIKARRLRHRYCTASRPWRPAAGKSHPRQRELNGTTATRTGGARESVADREDRLDLDGDVAGKRADPDGRAGMAAGIAEDFSEKVRAAVDHLRMVGEGWHGVDHAEDLGDEVDAPEVAAERFPGDGEEVHAGEARMLVGRR